MSEQYEVLAIRYGTRESSAAEVFLNYHAYHEPDRPLRMDYFFWVARNAARTVVVDTGFSPVGGAARDGPPLASDAVHYYEELERDRPFATVANRPDLYAAFDQISELAQAPGTRVVAGHDPLVAERFGRSGPVIQLSA